MKKNEDSVNAVNNLQYLRWLRARLVHIYHEAEDQAIIRKFDIVINHYAKLLNRDRLAIMNSNITDPVTNIIRQLEEAFSEPGMTSYLITKEGAKEIIEVLKAQKEPISETAQYEIVNQYQQEMQQIAKIIPHEPLQQLRGPVGILKELGELTDTVYRVIYYGDQLDEAKIANVKEELGDILWYLSDCAATFGFDLSDIFLHNLTKLRKRYPKGHFTKEDQELRADKDGESDSIKKAYYSQQVIFD